MQDFLQWVESKSQIRVIGHQKHNLGPGEITFQVGPNTYTYAIDAGYFYNGPLPRLIKYAPGKALAWVKKVAELTHKNRKPIQPEPSPAIQQELF